MIRKRKTKSQNLPLQFRAYKIESVKQAKVETKKFKVYQFGDLPYRKQDRKNVIKQFCSLYGINWPYAHYSLLGEEISK
jgi:hypothetical protein